MIVLNSFTLNHFYAGPDLCSAIIERHSVKAYHYEKPADLTPVFLAFNARKDK